MAAPDGWFTPAPRGHGMATRSALVIIAEPHPAVATTLVLQEMGYAVDLGSSADSALAWLQQAHYEVIVTGGPGIVSLGYLARLRDAAPASRILALDVAPAPEADSPADGTDAGAAADNDIATPGIEVVQPPFDVNALVQWLVGV